MENKVNYIQAIIFISWGSETKETQKIRQNPEKWGCDSLQCTLMAEFHLYWAKMQITLLF